jgi:predicted metal-binding protein
MKQPINVGIIICDRYRSCAGGKCFRSVRQHDGGFARYVDRPVNVVGYTTCEGCPGGNVEYAPAEMIKNGAEVIHLATGLVVGYPPCPYVFHFRDFIKKAYGVEVVIGTHPIPEKYRVIHEALGTWKAPEWDPVIDELREKAVGAYN